MKCPRCGAEAGAGRFCSQCGASLTATGPVVDSEGPTVVGAVEEARRASSDEATVVDSTPARGAGRRGGKASALDASVASGGERAGGGAERLIGRKVGPVRITSKIGAGGMGVVYKGRHENLDKDVAVKVLPESFVSDEALLERFRREARAAARVDHPHIVHIYDLGEEDGRAFIIQEYVDGTPLDRLLRERGALPAARALGLTRGVALALAAAHEAGLIHRDVKPSNVMVTRAGEPKVLDFGLAKVVTSGPEAARLSLTGQVMGTPLYMSPEQCTGKGQLDARSDLYSLGVMLFELLAGRRPFEAETVHGLLMAHTGEPAPDVASLAPSTPPAVAAIVRRLLEKKPEARYQSAREVVRALDAALIAFPAGAETMPDAQGSPQGAGLGLAQTPAAGALLSNSVAGSTPGSGAGSTPKQIVITPLSPPGGSLGPPPGYKPPVLTPPTTPATLEEDARFRDALRGAYWNPLSWLLSHGWTTVALLAAASALAGVYVASHVEAMRPWIFLAGFPSVALAAAIFSPRALAPVAAALLPAGIFCAAFCALVDGSVNDTDALVIAGVETAACSALAIVFHIVSRRAGGPRPGPLAFAVLPAIVMWVAVDRVEDVPFGRAVYETLMKRAAPLEEKDPREALRIYEAATAVRGGQDYFYAGDFPDSRYRAALLHIDGEGPGFDAARGEALLESIIEGYHTDVDKEARGFAVGYFSAKGEPKRALKFIPERSSTEFGWDNLDADELGTLYFVAWKQARAHGLWQDAKEIQERGAARSPEFVKLAQEEQAGRAPGRKQAIGRDAPQAPPAPPLGPGRRPRAGREANEERHRILDELRLERGERRSQMQPPPAPAKGKGEDDDEEEDGAFRSTAAPPP